MLTMKVMLWWAQKCGAEGLAWSSADLQQQRWQGCGPPDLLYRKLLPEAGLALSKALPLRLATASLRIRGGGELARLDEEAEAALGQRGERGGGLGDRQLRGRSGGGIGLGAAIGERQQGEGEQGEGALHSDLR